MDRFRSSAFFIQSDIRKCSEVITCGWIDPSEENQKNILQFIPKMYFFFRPYFEIWTQNRTDWVSEMNNLSSQNLKKDWQQWWRLVFLHIQFFLWKFFFKIIKQNSVSLWKIIKHAKKSRILKKPVPSLSIHYTALTNINILNPSP